MTPFALLCGLAGLSQREAGELLNMRPDSIKSAAAGRRPTPEGALHELRTLIARQERAAGEALAQIEALTKSNGAPDMIELGFPADDYEARALGWSCVGAWRGMAARVLAASPLSTRLVPRGSTQATAAATDAHGR